MKVVFLMVATAAMLALDLLVGISGTLYLGPVAGIAIVAFLIAVVAAVVAKQPVALFALHNAALIYFVVRNINARYTEGVPAFIAIAVAVNLLVWLVVRLRGSVAISVF